MADNLLLPISIERILDSNGDPVSGAKINVYDAGTTDFKNVFTNNTLVTAAANPIIADSGGYVEPRFIGTGDYKLVITDSSDVTIKTADNLTGALDTSSFANDTAIPTTPIIVKSSNYTVQTTDRGTIINSDSTGGNFTITLLSAATAGDNFRVTIKHVGTANEVTVATSGGDTLDGATSFLLDAQYETITCTSDGADWHISDDAQIFTAPLPVGVVIPYGGASAPTGWFLCDGSAKSRTGNSALFAVISTTFGVGDGSTTFNIPDMGGRVPAGKESSATRLTSGGSGVDGATLGAVGGAETHTLTTAELAIHSHGGSGLTAASDGGETLAVPRRAFNTSGASDNTRLSLGNDGGATGTFNVATSNHTHSVSGSTDNAGSGDAHNNAQPTIILNYIIKAT